MVRLYKITSKNNVQLKLTHLYIKVRLYIKIKIFTRYHTISKVVKLPNQN